LAVWLFGRGSYYRIQAFEHVADAIAFFHRFSEASLYYHPDMFMCVVKFKVLQLRNVAAKGYNQETHRNEALRSHPILALRERRKSASGRVDLSAG
jgi:hypothetical protein